MKGTKQFFTNQQVENYEPSKWILFTTNFESFRKSQFVCNFLGDYSLFVHKFCVLNTNYFHLTESKRSNFFSYQIITSSVSENWFINHLWTWCCNPESGACRFRKEKHGKKSQVKSDEDDGDDDKKNLMVAFFVCMHELLRNSARQNILHRAHLCLKETL